MAISGSLEDVSVADVLQFIHLGRRTGTLVLELDGQDAAIGFDQGKLVSARAPGTPKLGGLLVAAGLIERADLDDAMQRQADEPEHRNLGQILLSRGILSPDDLHGAIVSQIETTVAELIRWERGTFEFIVDDKRPVDEIALYLGDLVPDADINTQMVLLEAARIFDERNRDAEVDDVGDETQGVAPPPPAEPVPEPEPAAHRLQIVTDESELAERLTRALPPGFAPVERVALRGAGRALPGHETPIVLVDLRAEEVAVDDLARFRRVRVGTPVIALSAPGEPTGPVYEAGALAVLPPEVEAVVSCVANVARNRRRSAPLPSTADGGETEEAFSGVGVARLRRVFGDLRSGLISATVALNLMHIISESVERAVLFLVKREGLSALGAFGTGADGRPLAELTRGLALDGSADDVLTRSMLSGEVTPADFDEAGLPPELARLLGRPASGQVVVFPVLGAQKVISVIYTDNGENESPIEDIDILELATAQVGMAFENELLRRQISQQG